MSALPPASCAGQDRAGDGAIDASLEVGFSTFVEAARRLEDSYAALKLRADAIDSQLAEANRRLETTLAEREAVFRALPVGVVSCGADGSVLVCNPEAERLAAAVADAGFRLEALPAGEHDIADVALRVQRVERTDGSGTVIVVEDRTRVVALEHEVDRLDRLAGLSELALGVAHEIKNPLNGVMGFASLMERHEDPAELRRCARRIVDGVHRVDEIVKSMLAFARPTDARASLPLQLRRIVSEAVVESAWPADAVSIDGDASICVDGPMTTRVLSNLFRNAREAGARRLRLHVYASRPADRLVVVDIADDGPGVDGALSERLFEPFVTTKDVASEGARGLGLAMVARILSFLGGAIELVHGGSDGSGATFRIRLPRLEPAVHEVTAGG